MPAMSDFANSEALKEAKKYDPDGRRTLGVVTKTDNVQAGCGIKAKLRMEDGHVRLKLGFIAVVNRTPIEVEEDTPAEEVRAREEKFFTTNSELAGLEKERWGLDTLVERIVEIQEERIEEVSVRLARPARKSVLVLVHMQSLFLVVFLVVGFHLDMFSKFSRGITCWDEAIDYKSTQTSQHPRTFHFLTRRT